MTVYFMAYKELTLLNCMQCVWTSLCVLLQDRYASSRTMPSIDRHQDWHLTNAGEENGHTMMEFHRLLKTGDVNDFDIPVSCMIVQQDNQSQRSIDE